MAEARYKLRCSILGHEKDVRGIVPALYPEGGFISVSRDVTAKVWMVNDTDLSFTEAHLMRGHNNFVTCVCVMPPDEKHPQGLIMTGSNDNDILAYTLESPSPLYKLEGHSNTVCALAAGKFGTLVSGSWDQTAKVWLNQKCLMTLKGHEAAVWCVAILPEGGFMLTGSADKTIKMWKAGRCEKTFKGHNDCVRGLAVLSTTEFLSCSNDSSVKRWSTSGDCLQTYYSHTNYVYSLALLPNGTDFVTGGEDRTVRVWRGGECVQTLTHPAQSVWTVCTLPNGDIITGASDGMVRLFSAEPIRQAPTEEQAAYEEQLSSSSITTHIGDVPVDKLPGPEALINPGKKDGQSLMVRDDGAVHMYQWDAADSRWVKIGDVVGGSGGTQSSSGKQLYQGKEYDYVFDVDLDEGSPPLKLPYNLSEDPWMAAHNFLEKNEISQLLLDQVANFIQEQTKGVTINSAPAQGMTDPFTGAGRYVPGGGAAPGQAPGGTDPFTGGGRYVPSSDGDGVQPNGGVFSASQSHGADPLTGSGSYKPGASKSQIAPAHFPIRNTLQFDQGNMKAIIDKLCQFNQQADSSMKLSDDVISRLGEMMSGKSNDDLPHLASLLQWPANVLFPVLDILRLSIRSPHANKFFCNPSDESRFLQVILSCLNAESPVANQMLSMRVLSNIFLHDPGRHMLLTHRDQILAAVVSCRAANKNLQIAASTVLLNYAIAFLQVPDIESKSQCMSAALTISESQTEAEANYRLLVCIGTLINNDFSSTELAKSLGIVQFVNRCKLIEQPSKLGECARQLESAL